MQKLKRGDIFKNVEIVDIASGGKAVGKVDNIVIFVNEAVPGDIVDVIIVSVKRRYYEGNVVSYLQHSAKKTEARCSHFGICGGCKWQNLDYAEQLKFKQKQVIDNLTRIGKIAINSIEEIIPSENIYYYRNKLEYTFTNKRWLTKAEFNAAPETPVNMNGLGFHIPGMFSKVLDIDECFLQPSPSNDIRLAVKKFAINNAYTFFDLKEQTGLLRNIIIRTSTQNELMVIVVFHNNDKEKINALMQHLAEQFAEITSLMYVVNDKRNDTISDLEIITYKGKDHLIEKMDDLFFRIGPKSFFQTNSKQAYKLYNVVKDFASLTGKETVYDLYTGTGTIAIFLSPAARSVIGIDNIEQAIENAKENSAFNHQENTYFVSGIMEKILDNDFIESNGKPDVVITDPPRSGMHPKVVEQLMQIEPAKIVYVSCNPSTQARDIALMSDKYEVAKVQAVDMFPHTEHVESVALLVRK